MPRNPRSTTYTTLMKVSLSTGLISYTARLTNPPPMAPPMDPVRKGRPRRPPEEAQEPPPPFVLQDVAGDLDFPSGVFHRSHDQHPEKRFPFPHHSVAPPSVPVFSQLREYWD